MTVNKKNALQITSYHILNNISEVEAINTKKKESYCNANFYKEKGRERKRKNKFWIKSFAK